MACSLRHALFHGSLPIDVRLLPAKPLVAWAAAFLRGAQPMRMVVLPPVEIPRTQLEGSVGTGSQTIFAQSASNSSQTIIRKPVELPWPIS